MDFEWLEDVVDAGISRPRHLNERADDFTTYSDNEFRKRYRLKKETVRYLLTFLNDLLTPPTKRNHSISANLQVLTALRLLAGGSYQTVCGDLSGLSQASVSRIFIKVINAICTLRAQFVRFPNDVGPIKQAFYEIAGFPGVIGCIDGTHVPIFQPRAHAQTEIFRSRKGYFSINVQLVCGPNNTIYHVVARWPGSTHDSRIFTNSSLFTRLENNEFTGILLGDGGYPCKR